ncbi:MAG: hypothetical protein JOY80_05770 [Candidatus Dormibacteraeota bacterium]|nr:hypothetical protein [Candidatus Dormibacteraeota bacterium]
MVVYIIVGLVLLVGLVFAYRTLGGAATHVDPLASLAAVMADAQRLADAMTSSQHTASWGDRQTEGGQRAPLPARWRRTAEGARQQLLQIDAVSLDETSSSAHALLSVAVDELSWAARLQTADAYRSSEGMQQAVDELLRHAGACLGDAAPLLRGSDVAKEVESPR